LRPVFVLNGRCTCGGTVAADGIDGTVVREILHAWTEAHSGPEHHEASIGWGWEIRDGATGAAAAEATD
jgi:hypothetical protein